MFRKVSSSYDQHEIEPRILKFWDEHDFFHQLVQKNIGGKRFSFIDGPITANNKMGVHHAWGRTYKDIFVRYKSMQGAHQRYQNGFDCQGLWVEVEVEKELGLNSKKDIRAYGLDRFSTRCKERVREYAAVISEQSRRLGQWMDWENSYFTMTDTNIEYIWMFLKRCHENGWLYRGKHVMPWCIRCGTSLSQHEMVDSYREVKHPSVFLQLPIVGRENEFFMVWTTTPWTLAANTALAVNPDLVYVKANHGGKVVFLSKGTLAAVLGEGAEVMSEHKGEEFEGFRYKGPFAELPIQQAIDHRVVCDKMVGETEGTGIVHIAPGCGAEDFEVHKREGIGIVDPVDEAGRYLDGFGELTGMRVTEVAPIVYESLRKKGYLVKKETLAHRYPVCWRCGDELIFRLVEEWFIRCDALRKPLIDAARTVKWIPDYMGRRMEDWLNNMQDWCISRRRFWGLPLPFYHCSDCGHITIVGSRSELARLAEMSNEELPELHRPWIDAVPIKCERCGGKALRTEDVGDCWMDAGIVPFSTLRYKEDHEYWERWFPAEFVCEMREQIRLWFYSMLFMSVTLEGRSPYKSVLIYEKVFDEHGEPMHRARGNVLWFDEAVDKMGADIMRWLFASQNTAYNVSFGYGPGKEIKRSLLTFWNAYSFFMTYASLDQPNVVLTDSPTDGLTELDRWVLSRLHTIIHEATEAYERYNVMSVVKQVEAFFDDLSNWNIRRNRRRFWRATSDTDKQAAYQTLYTVLVEVTKLIAPIVPFLSEEIYQNLVVSVHPDAPRSVHLSEFPRANRELVDEGLEADAALAKRVVSLGLSARNKAGIKVRQPLGKMLVRLEGDNEREGLDRFLPDTLDELNVKAVQVVDSLQGVAEPIVRFNLKLVGPRLGPKLVEARRVLESERARVYESAVKGEPVFLTVDGEKLPFESSELILDLEAREGYSVAATGAFAVALDTTLDEQLIVEGMVRELVRHVQVMRKDAGFNVEDRIGLYVACGDEVRSRIEQRIDFLSQETLATEVRFGESPEGAFSRSITLPAVLGTKGDARETEQVTLGVMRRNI